MLVYNQGQPEEGVYTLFVQVLDTIVDATENSRFVLVDRCHPLNDCAPRPPFAPVCVCSLISALVALSMDSSAVAYPPPPPKSRLGREQDVLAMAFVLVDTRSFSSRGRSCYHNYSEYSSCSALLNTPFM